MRGTQAILILLLAIASAGCAGASAVLPDSSPPDNITQVSYEGMVGRTLWGLWDARLDKESLTVNVTPMRSADFTCNVTRFMQPPYSPVNMLSISIGPGSDPANGFFIVDVTVRHPFPGLNKFNGFDVRGILLSNGSEHGIHDPSVIIAAQGETRLKNADGYTRWWNYPEFTTYGTIFGFTFGSLAPPNQPTATVNPYKYFADGLDADAQMSELNTANRGFFSTNPGVNTRRYEIQFKNIGGQNILDFQYAVDASWALPDPAFEPEYPVEAFPLSANCAEAFMVEVTDAGSDAWWGGPGQSGGKLVLDIAVSDWQGLENPGGALGQISEIWLEGPVLNGAVEVLGSAQVIDPGGLTAVVRATIDDLNLTQSGPEYLFGAVVSSSPSTYEPQVPGGSAFAHPDAPLSAYFLAQVDIKAAGEKPIWPTLQGNRANTGYVGLQGPAAVHDAPTWTHLWQPNPYGNPLPVFLSEDNAFLSNTGDGGPLPCGAVDLITKTTKWNQQFHDDMQNWLNLKAISEDGEVALCYESKYALIYGLDVEDGSELWHIPGTIKVDAYPTTDLDGNFIIPVDEYGYQSVEAHTGTINWTSQIGVGYYDIPAVGDNGVIYATSGGQWDGVLCALDPADGTTNWTSQGLGQLRMNGVTVHPNGTIILHSEQGLFCFKDNGDSCGIAWQKPYPCPFFSSVGVGSTGDIYMMDYEGVLRRLDPATGDTLQYTEGWGDGVSFRPAIGADGLIYAATRLYDENEAYMTCWKPDCTLHWQYYAGQWFMGDGLMAAPAIGQDGTLYSSYRTLGLCAWKD